jgi:hypothetical protein
VFGFIFGVRWGERCAIVLALVSFSHWLLDLVVHRHGMPILPRNLGNLPKLGFGLWQFGTSSILADLLLVILGAWCAGGRQELSLPRHKEAAIGAPPPQCGNIAHPTVQMHP